jgi:hypothetical protein
MEFQTRAIATDDLRYQQSVSFAAQDHSTKLTFVLQVRYPITIQPLMARSSRRNASHPKPTSTP